MKVLLFPSSFSPVLGGLQAVTRTLAQGILSQELPVHVVTNRYPKSLPGYETLEKIPVSRYLLLKPNRLDLERGRVDLFLASFFYYPLARSRLNHLIRQFKPDIVNVHFPDAQIPFVLELRKKHDFSLVVSLHGDEVERWFEKNELGIPRDALSKGNYQYRRYLRLKKILALADSVTACSNYLLTRAIRIENSVSQKGTVIHNGIDWGRFQLLEQLPPMRPFILAYGRMTREKGYDLLLEAFARICHSFPNVDLVLGGDGTERHTLQQQAAALGLGGRLKMVGRIDADQIPVWLSKALFVVVPSRRETFGLTALEGMAAGKAVLATNVGGLPEFLDPSINCLIDCNVDALTLGLGEFLANPEKVRDRGRQNRRVAQEFSEQTMVNRYLQVFQKASL